MVPSMDFSIEKSYRDGNVIEVLNVSNPWIGLGLLREGNEFTLTNSTRLVDDVNKERISIDITYDSSNSVTHTGTTYQGLKVGESDTDEVYIRCNQVSRVLYYHTRTTTYVIGLLVQAIRYRKSSESNKFGNIHLLYKVFDPIASGVITDSRVSTLTPLLRGDYRDISDNRTLNTNWNTLKFGTNTYTNPNLITLHTLLSIDEDSIKSSIPDYEIPYYIDPNNIMIKNTNYNTNYPDLLGWRVRDKSSLGVQDYIWNPGLTDALGNNLPQNSLLSGNVLFSTDGVNVIPSIALRLIDIENISDNFRVSNSRLSISRNNSNLRIQTDIDNMSVYSKESYILDVRNSGVYRPNGAIEGFNISKLTQTYKIQTIDSLYVNGREVNYKYPLSSISLVESNTSSGGTVGGGGTTGGSGGDSGVVDGPNPPSSGVSSGAPDISTSTDDELNQDNL